MTEDKDSISELRDWTKAEVDGMIHVPDELDQLVNSIGFQFMFFTISGKNEIKAICDTAFIAQKFFNKNYIVPLRQKIKLLEEENKELKDKLKH